MLIKILGGIDVIGGLFLVFGIGNSFSTSFLLFFGMIFLLKAICLGMLQDFASWVDFLAGVVFLLWILIPIYWLIGWVLGVLVFQKGILSFVDF